MEGNIVVEIILLLAYTVSIVLAITVGTKLLRKPEKKT